MPRVTVTERSAADRRVSVERTHSFDARRLVVENLELDLSVAVKSAGPIDVRVRGARRDVDALAVAHEAHTLHLGRSPGLSGRIEVALAVPTACAVELRAVRGDVVVGDTHGDLALQLDGAVHVRAGEVADAQVTIDGDGGVEIAHVSGRRVAISVSGAGRSRVGGHAERLDACVVGSGNVVFEGTVDEAELNVDGPGYINVGRVWRKLRRGIVGSGDIRVAFPPRVDSDSESFPQSTHHQHGCDEHAARGGQQPGSSDSSSG